MPEPWLSDAYATRRARCKVPEELAFQTKPQLAGAMVRELSQDGILPFKYVVADCLYGNSPDFLEALEACRGLTYMVAIPADTHCWLQGPVLDHKPYRYKGEARTKRTVAQQDSHPPSVEPVAQGIHDGFWYRRTVSEGTKGPIADEFTKRRIMLCRDGRPDRAVWLVIKRGLGEPPSYWYDIGNAPWSTRLPMFVWLSGVRWAIEQCFEEGKTELGINHYEVRQYSGWHHHMWICMLAHFLLWHGNIPWGEKALALTLPQVRTLLEVVLPLRTYRIEDVLKLVAWVQQRNHRAYLSPKKRRKPKG